MEKTISMLSGISVKLFIVAGVMAAIVVALAMPLMIHAETFNTAVMPVIYNQSSQAVNVGTGYLAAGIYYLPTANSTQNHAIEYYGNGTYYDPSILQYGGSVRNPNGTAAVSLAYASSSASPVYVNAGAGMAMMPTLTNQNGLAVNSNGVSLPAGTYYLNGNQIQYYGNGTYYDPTTMQYGGSINNPNGTAGVSLGYKA